MLTEGLSLRVLSLSGFSYGILACFKRKLKLTAKFAWQVYGIFAVKFTSLVQKISIEADQEPFEEALRASRYVGAGGHHGHGQHDVCGLTHLHGRVPSPRWLGGWGEKWRLAIGKGILCKENAFWVDH